VYGVVLSRLAAGALETTVANSATPQDRNSGVALGGLGYRPAIVDQPGALIGLYKLLLVMLLPGSYAAEALRLVLPLHVLTTLGITDPQDTAETALTSWW
jgi:hypothetical protein